jgi:DNA-binding transcriptional LysR family regulator
VGVQARTDERAIGRGPRFDDVVRRLEGLDLGLVRTVVRVSEVGSITGAAPGLGYSQPGLSQRVKAAEQALGHRLFHRGTKGVTLTEVGATVLPYVRALLAVADSLAHEIAHARTTSEAAE